MDREESRFLEVAYEESDGSPMREVSSEQVSRKLGVDDDRQRRIERSLMDRGLLEDAGTGYRLRLAAIHRVEEERLEDGQNEIVDERREQRGDYVRELYALADEDPTITVPLSDVQESFPYPTAIETRTREYLVAAGLIEVNEKNQVGLTKQGADWAAES